MAEQLPDRGSAVYLLPPRKRVEAANEAAGILLTRAELEALTGTKQPKRMADWLTARSWVFEPAPRRGQIPRVGRAYYLARMSGQQPSTAGGRRVAPNADWMTRRTG